MGATRETRQRSVFRTLCYVHFFFFFFAFIRYVLKIQFICIVGVYLGGGQNHGLNCPRFSHIYTNYRVTEHGFYSFLLFIVIVGE